jgi:hypothetical protein
VVVVVVVVVEAVVGDDRDRVVKVELELEVEVEVGAGFGAGAGVVIVVVAVVINPLAISSLPGGFITFVLSPRIGAGGIPNLVPTVFFVPAVRVEMCARPVPSVRSVRSARLTVNGKR